MVDDAECDNGVAQLDGGIQHKIAHKFVRWRCKADTQTSRSKFHIPSEPPI